VHDAGRGDGVDVGSLSALDIKHRTEDTGVVEGGTVPPSVTELVLTLLYPHAGALTDHVQQLVVVVADLALLGLQERQVRACVLHPVSDGRVGL